MAIKDIVKRMIREQEETADTLTERAQKLVDVVARLNTEIETTLEDLEKLRELSEQLEKR